MTIINCLWVISMHFFRLPKFNCYSFLLLLVCCLKNFLLFFLKGEKFLAIDEYQNEYARYMMLNPLFASTIHCGEVFALLEGCVEKKGPKECQEESMKALTCAAQVFAPVEFEKW